VTDLSFRVSMPTDEGFIGRECGNSGCGRYFRVHMDSLSEEMNCPYCGQRFDKSDLLTADQLDYVRQAAAEKALEHISAELGRMFEKSTRGNRYLTFNPGTPYRAKPVEPTYEERKVDSEIVCPVCSARFQVDGIFAHCVGCGNQNIAIYDANLELIRAEVTAAQNPQRVLRHAYNDLVSTFESICAKRAALLTTERGSFQDPYEARRFFKKHAGVDLLAELDDAQRLAVRRAFHKRHAWQHSRGIITERYVKKVPEDAPLLGSEATLSMQEFDLAVVGVRHMVDTLPIAG
jgi:uncharacterized Zn-finger protein